MHLNYYWYIPNIHSLVHLVDDSRTPHAYHSYDQMIRLHYLMVGLLDLVNYDFCKIHVHVLPHLHKIEKKNYYNIYKFAFDRDGKYSIINLNRYLLSCKSGTNLYTISCIVLSKLMYCSGCDWWITFSHVGHVLFSSKCLTRQLLQTEKRKEVYW